ncbi:MAG TPA: nitronate monooxygenase [Candidatus Nanoarchaeia archaeon]|nr:nitronate monooxygenase [Candidatus Nanoarchaeia archaeon]
MSLENAFKQWKETGKMPFSIIQGGMGAGVSDYGLARTVSSLGQFGVVSGTAPEAKMVQELQQGDRNGEIRFALSKFPNQEIAQSIIDKYFVEGGRKEGYLGIPFPTLKTEGKVAEIANQHLENLVVAGSFAEVFLAKQGHSNPVGINLLYKIQWPLLAGVYGAMLADVDMILMGAGLATDVPPAIDAFSRGESASINLDVTNSKGYSIRFDPSRIIKVDSLNKPMFNGIVSLDLAAKILKNADGYVMEGPIAGGHNPNPRNHKINETGQPDYTAKDDVNFAKLYEILNGRPFWLAGAYAGKLKEALALGAAGVQIGTPFAYSKDSHMRDDLRKKALAEIMAGATVFTDPRASPTRYPFKVNQISGTLSEKDVYDNRKRVCNKGYLVEWYEGHDGNLKSRCPSEPVDLYVKKGGELEETKGRKCLCNGLLTTIGAGSPNEPPLLTSGADFSVLKELVAMHGMDYTAKHAIDLMLEKSR